MNRSRASGAWPAVAGGLVLLAFVLCAPAVSADEFEASGRNVQFMTSLTWLPVGETGDHGIGTYEGEGITFLPDGEVATIIDRGTYELYRSDMTYQGFVIRTFTDGSTVTSRYHGVSWLDDEGVRKGKGSAMYVGGTGRFAGVKGEGTFSGVSYGKMSVSDWKVSGTLPD